MGGTPIVNMSVYDDMQTKPPLIENFYNLDAEEIAFLKSHTGIQDEKELKQHVLSVQARAYEIFGYPCIRFLLFAKLSISRLPAYPHLLQLAREKDGAIFLDLACGFGNATRKVIEDGWPVQNILASDLKEEFWNYGYDLFKSTPETFSVPFITGDVFDPCFIAAREPFYDSPGNSRLELDSVTSLKPLQGQVSAINASLFFHLFDEEKQLELARKVGSLLSPIPGSIILGVHRSRPLKGMSVEAPSKTRHNIFFHSPESWEALWNGQVFKKGSVRVDARLVETTREDTSNEDNKFYMMEWSVTRL